MITLLAILIVASGGVAAQAELVTQKLTPINIGCVYGRSADDETTRASDDDETTRASDDPWSLEGGIRLTGKPAPETRLRFNGNVLQITKHKRLVCNSSQVGIEVKRSGNVFWISSNVYQISDMTADCYCDTENTSKLVGVDEGEYYFVTDEGVFLVNLTQGLDVTLRPEDANVDVPTVRTDAEWVYYNPGNEKTAAQFVRMRVTEENEYGRDFRKVRYCIGDYDASKAIGVATISESDFKVNVASEMGVHSLVMALSGKWQDVVEIPNVSHSYSFTSEDALTYDFSQKWVVPLRISDIRPTTVDGKPSLHYIYENGLETVMGVGPVGEGYSSNLALPAFELPTRAVPTHFLYMRSLKDNHIIYGDPTLDPSYSGTAAMTAANDAAWLDNGEEFGIRADGEAEVSVYDLEGKLIAAQRGSDEVLVARSQLDAGIYLVRASAPGLMLTRKIIVRLP